MCLIGYLVIQCRVEEKVMEDTEMMDSDVVDGSSANLVNTSVQQQESAELPTGNGHMSDPKATEDDDRLADGKVDIETNETFGDSLNGEPVTDKADDGNVRQSKNWLSDVEV